MNRVFGLETEYGITVNGAETVDVVAESIELVRRYTDHGAHMKWDYDLEDPHLDARGFRAKALMQDTDESAYYEIDKNRPLSFEEIKSDLVLSNGARFSPAPAKWAWKAKVVRPNRVFIKFHSVRIFSALWSASTR